jgi:hypothetical protein
LHLQNGVEDNSSAVVDPENPTRRWRLVLRDRGREQPGTQAQKQNGDAGYLHGRLKV